MSHSHTNQEAEKAARRAAIECSYRAGNISVIKYAGGVSSTTDIKNAIKFLQALLQVEDNYEQRT